MHKDLLDYVPAAAMFKDRVILVTGAAMGIGRAVAIQYARFGATVVLVDKQTNLLNEVYDEIVSAAYPEPVICELDLTKAEPSAYEQLVHMIAEELGRLDGLVLNAAWLSAFMPIRYHDLAMWDQMLTANLTANFRLVRACLPLLEISPDPAIIFSSDSSDKPYYGAYGVSKAALDAFASILAKECDKTEHFVRVNSIDTGPVRTRLRVLNYPGDPAENLALPQSVVGPYLYFMGADAGKRSGEMVRFERLPADLTWRGESVDA